MQLTELLSQKGLVLGHSPMESILDRINKRKASSTALSIIYGETFDEKGHPIDSLKYYFFVSMLSKILTNLYEINITPTILIADLGVYRNYPAEIEQFKKIAEERKKFADKVKKIYKCTYEVRLMSDFVSTNEFGKKLQKIKEVSFANPIVLEMIEKTVPEDRLEMERKRGYAYSFEEIATILGLDIKVGPPREKLYDRTANLFLKYFDVEPLLSIYLYPTYPLGLPYGAYLSSPSIKEFGLTPYKVGSGDMTANRIALGKTSLEEIKNLIENTQVSQSTKRPNPILDLLIITEMAKQHLEGEFKYITIYDEFYSQKVNIRTLKDIAYKNLKEYVLKFF
jgi:hypothetical protein